VELTMYEDCSSAGRPDAVRNLDLKPYIPPYLACGTA